jgi:riboflavin synthase
MFTGIVEETGTIKKIKPTTKSIRLGVRARICARQTRVGDSVAVNGCCLTVVKTSALNSGRLLEFDLLRETWERTNFQEADVGAAVNLERSLQLQDRFGGHFVTGHIDGTGEITRWERAGKDWVLEIQAGPELMRYMLFKGAVAVDGISLTVADVQPNRFRIWIIPHTYEVTALRERSVGDQVNLEADLLGKYVERFVTAKDISRLRRVKRRRT